MTPGALAWIVANPHQTGSCSVTIRGGKVKVDRGVASIKVSAPAGASSNSTGTLTVRTPKAVKLPQAAGGWPVARASSRCSLSPPRALRARSPRTRGA
jgi:hypothetical protein